MVGVTAACSKEIPVSTCFEVIVHNLRLHRGPRLYVAHAASRAPFHPTIWRFLQPKCCSLQPVQPLTHVARVTDGRPRSSIVSAIQFSLPRVPPLAIMDGELSAYEAKRQRRMAENRAVLQSLNIERPSAPKRARPSRPEAPVEPVERRRSQRIAKLEAGDDNEKPHELEELVEVVSIPKKLPVIAAEMELPVVDLSGVNFGWKSKETSAKIAIDMAAFHDQWLGRQLLPMSKRPIMQALGDASGAIVTFAFISGVQQWKNAVVLFVNVESAGTYSNPFQHVTQEDGRPAVYFQWFAQRQLTAQSPSVRRLCRIQPGDKQLFLDAAAVKNEGDEEEPLDDPLLLFLRRNGESAYVYCGRLAFLGHRPSKQPIEFRWQLMDTEAFDWKAVWQQLNAKPLDNAGISKPPKTES